MKVTFDTEKPTEVFVMVGTKKTPYGALERNKQADVCKALEAARLRCSMTIKSVSQKEGDDNSER